MIIPDSDKTMADKLMYNPNDDTQNYPSLDKFARACQIKENL